MFRSRTVSAVLPFLIGSALAAGEGIQTFHNDTGRTLLLAVRPGPSLGAILLTRHSPDATGTVIFEDEDLAWPAMEQLPRLRLAPGAWVDFTPSGPRSAPACARFFLYQESNRQHLGYLAFMDWPALGQTRLTLVLSEYYAEQVKAVPRDCWFLSNPGWTLEEAQDAGPGCWPW